MIKFIIKLLRGAGNAAGAGAESVVKAAKNMIGAVEGDYQGIVNEYENDQSSVTLTKMASSIAVGDIALIATDSLLASTITESLIGIINADDSLATADQKYEDFVDSLYNIEDWDNKLGIWSTTLIGGATSPYVKLLVKSTALIAKMATVGMIRSDKIQNGISKDLSDINKLFNTLLSHNSRVSGVLREYDPYQPSELIDLTRLLSAAGLLNSFAIGLSLTSMVASIIKEIPDIPTLKTCIVDHEDLFPLDDEWVAKAVYKMGYIPDASLNSSSIDAAESSADDVSATMLKLDALDINKDLEQTDMLNGDIYIDAYENT